MRYIFLDTETTSLDRRKRQIWDLAYIIRDAENNIDDEEKQFFFNVSLKDADPMSLKIGRFYERHPEPYFMYGSFTSEEAGYLREVAKDFQGATLVGAVPSFDEETLARMMHKRLFLQPTWRYHLIDIETLIAGRMGMLPPWNYEEVIQRTGLPPIKDEDRHTAMGDARTVRDLWDWWIAGATS